MRFTFCGDQDCPDWVLAQIGEIAKLSAIRLKQLCSQVILVTLSEQGLEDEVMQKMIDNLKLKQPDIVAIISALEWIFVGGAKNRVEHNKLQEELEQLGTPREHASVLSRIYRDSRDQLTVFLQKKSLRLSTLESCEGTVLHEQQNKAFVLDILIKSANTVTNRKVVMNGTNFSVLKQELELAVEKMEQYLQ